MASASKFSLTFRLHTNTLKWKARWLTYVSAHWLCRQSRYHRLPVTLPAMMSMLPISITPLMKAMIWNWTLPTALHASGFGRRRRRKSGCGFMLTHAEGIRYRKYQWPRPPRAHGLRKSPPCLMADFTPSAFSKMASGCRKPRESGLKRSVSTAIVRQ